MCDNPNILPDQPVNCSDPRNKDDERCQPKNKTLSTFIIVLIASVALVIIFLILWFYFRYRNKRPNDIYIYDKYTPPPTYYSSPVTNYNDPRNDPRYNSVNYLGQVSRPMQIAQPSQARPIPQVQPRQPAQQQPMQPTQQQPRQPAQQQQQASSMLRPPSQGPIRQFNAPVQQVGQQSSTPDLRKPVRQQFNAPPQQVQPQSKIQPPTVSKQNIQVSSGSTTTPQIRPNINPSQIPNLRPLNTNQYSQNQLGQGSGLQSQLPQGNLAPGNQTKYIMTPAGELQSYSPPKNPTPVINSNTGGRSGNTQFTENNPIIANR